MISTLLSCLHLLTAATLIRISLQPVNSTAISSRSTAQFPNAEPRGDYSGSVHGLLRPQRSDEGYEFQGSYSRTNKKYVASVNSAPKQFLTAADNLHGRGKRNEEFKDAKVAFYGSLADSLDHQNVDKQDEQTTFVFVKANGDEGQTVFGEYCNCFLGGEVCSCGFLSRTVVPSASLFLLNFECK